MDKKRTYRRNIFSLWEVTWQLLVALGTLYAVYRIPTELIMGHGVGFTSVFLDYFVIGTFLIDPIFTYRMLVKGPGSQRESAKYVLPIDIIVAISLIVFSATDWWLLLALLKVVHVTVFINVWRHQLLKGGGIVRLTLFLYWLAILNHLTAIGWVYIRSEPGTVLSQQTYLEAIYWAVTTLTTIGYGDITPESPNEMMFAIVIMIVGFLMMGYLIGNIASILNKSDPLRAQYAETLEEVSAFVQYNGLPSELKYRIVDYFSYMWQQKAGFSESKILGMLPSGIRTEISLHLKKDVIQRVPFFREAGETFIRQIANEMRPLVVTPGEFVFHAGDPATNMYFISHGELKVLTSDRELISTLSDGDFFGEIALIEKRRRMGSVQATDYCDLYELSAGSFHRIVDAHPDFKQYMQEVASQRDHSRDHST